jgi:DNA-binding transcriptional LysR family regulator
MQTELIGHRIKLQHLRVVMAVAQWGSMAKAAKRLAITQPVVSKVIADLEEVLGVRLFDRSPQGVEPTPYGSACSSAASRSSTTSIRASTRSSSWPTPRRENCGSAARNRCLPARAQP